ncbi:Ig-like domain repeat protein [Leucobacter weissii]|uniref:Ig-like domain repeat protein n=1 Tax=Leucobacter weissii TaxID=1983706 RepID=A0A939ML39_9MICO|nr:Ig-like domain repeat protein [Leucobacter weissii]MBO1902973.1 Ig-like domain repeat protein [Leucobacter weissii]
MNERRTLLRVCQRPIAAASAAALLLSGVALAAAAPAAADPQPTEHGTTLTLTGDPGAATSSAVSTASCDVNGDGLEDAVFGAWWWSKGAFSRIGAAYVALGTEEAVGGSLADPADVNAVRIDGPSRGNAFIGFTVSCAGDVNNDGFDDILIGDYLATSAYVVFGAEKFEPVSLDHLGSSGFTVKGPEGDTRFGYSVKGVGDVTGDGLDDFAVGSSSGNKVYVIPGKRDIDNIDLSVTPEAVVLTSTGSVVSNVGDVNGDRIDDLLFGAYTATPWGSSAAAAGSAHVIWGGQTGEIAVSDLSGKGFAVYGPTRARDRLGVSVAAAGDVNGDGKADLLLGADGVTNPATGPRNGGAAIVYGSDSDATVYTNPTAEVAVYTCDAEGVATTGDCVGTAAPRGYWINGAVASDAAGYSVAGIGDVNGDRVPDALIGAYGYDPIDPETGATMTTGGAAYVVYGDPQRTGAIELGSLTAAQGFRIDGGVAGDRFGRAVGSLSDFDGNGVDDLLIGADFAQSQAGQASIVLLGDLKTETSVTVSEGARAGGPLTLSATVKQLVDGGKPAAGGTVAFSDQGEPIDGCEAVTVSGGAAVCEIAEQPSAGEREFVATFAPGTQKLQSSTGSVATAVAKQSSSVVLGGDTAGVVGDEIEFTAAVPAAATGEVVFLAGERELGSAEIVDGVATFSYEPTAASSYRLTASYAGDDRFDAGASKAERVTVSPAPVFLSAVSLSALKAVYGVRASATVSVDGASSGTVLFTAGGRDLGTASVNADGVATRTLPVLPVGTYRVSAQFLGDDAHAESAKRYAAGQLTVTKASVSSARVTAKTAKRGARPTVTVRLGKLQSGSYPTGKVRVSFGSATKTVSLKASAKGVVRVKAPKALKSSTRVTAKYLGSANVTATSAKTTQKIRR